MTKKKEQTSDWQAIVGKTIKTVDEGFGINVIRIIFTDDTEKIIDIESIGHSLYRPILEDRDSYSPKSTYSPYNL